MRSDDHDMHPDAVLVPAGILEIERCWGILDNHWNGTVLNSIVGSDTRAWDDE